MEIVGYVVPWTAIATGVLVLVNVALVAVTWRYVSLVSDQVESSDKTAKATQQLAEATQKSVERSIHERSVEAIQALEELSEHAEKWWKKSHSKIEVQAPSTNPGQVFREDKGVIDDLRQRYLRVAQADPTSGEKIEVTEAIHLMAESNRWAEKTSNADREAVEERLVAFQKVTLQASHALYDIYLASLTRIGAIQRRLGLQGIEPTPDPEEGGVRACNQDSTR